MNLFLVLFLSENKWTREERRTLGRQRSAETQRDVYLFEIVKNIHACPRASSIFWMNINYRGN